MRAQIKTLPQELYSFLVERYRRLNQDNEVVVGEPAKKKGTCWLCGRKKLVCCNEAQYML